MSDGKLEIYECRLCKSKVYYPDTHERDCPYWGTRKGKP